jgi:hypothetical protein
MLGITQHDVRNSVFTSLVTTHAEDLVSFLFKMF